MTDNSDNSRFDTTLPYSEVVRVRFRDTDQQAHLYFANYMVYADEVGMSFLKTLGFNGINVHEAPCYLYIVNISCDFMSDCVADDRVRVFVGYDHLGRSSAELKFELFNDDTGVKLAAGRVTHVFVNKDTRSATRIPEALRNALIELQPELA